MIWMLLSHWPWVIIRLQMEWLYRFLQLIYCLKLVGVLVAKGERHGRFCQCRHYADVVCRDFILFFKFSNSGVKVFGCLHIKTLGILVWLNHRVVISLNTNYAFPFVDSGFRASPMASITIHNLLLYTTNEDWQVSIFLRSDFRIFFWLVSWV